MNKKTKTVMLIAAFALLIGAAVFAYDVLSEKVAPPSNIDAPSGGETPQNLEDVPPEKIEAPDFTVLDMDGNSVNLSDMIGKPIVVNFWASWCSPCKKEMPDFNEVYEEVGEDITFMMIDLVDGQRETIEKGTEYVNEQSFTFPVYFDAEQEAASIYGIRSIPTTLFIDKDGYIVTGAQGSIDADTLKVGIELIK